MRRNHHPTNGRLASLAGAILAIATAGVLTATTAQANTVSLDFVAEITFPASQAGCGGTPVTGGSDVWGYTAPDGTEYAIMGVMEGVAVVRIPDMTVIDVIPGPTLGDCYWHRDIKTWGHYAYIVSEMVGQNQGIMILDLSGLPATVEFVGAYTAPTQVRSHNLTIDTVTGYAYATDHGGAGFRVIDLSDPEAPVDVHREPTTTSHDVYALNDVLYLAEGFTGEYSIWDVSNKTNPVPIVEFTYPDIGYTHNIWPTDDGNRVVTTEETQGKTIKIWDISDMQNGNVTLLGEYLAPNGLAHNAQVLGDRMFVSHYSYGVVVVDISDPVNPVEIAHYDTYAPSDAGGFIGCWGVYQYTADGYVYASDFRGHLTLLQLNETTTSIEPVATVAPAGIDLLANVPNPFNPSTVVRFELSEPARARLVIFDAAGRIVSTLADGRFGAGKHELTWHGRDDRGRPVASGVYYQRLAVPAAGHELTRKMVLVQ